jgi:hypothetical protein
VNRKSEGTAIVSQIWMKEVGVDLNIEQVDGTIPVTYALEQNYPNPFNPSTVIRYAIPQDGIVTLKVYDITGREVVTLVNERKTAGTYEVTFDSRSSRNALASGIYFYKLVSGEYSQTKKLVLLK